MITPIRNSRRRSLSPTPYNLTTPPNSNTNLTTPPRIRLRPTSSTRVRRRDELYRTPTPGPQILDFPTMSPSPTAPISSLIPPNRRRIYTRPIHPETNITRTHGGIGKKRKKRRRTLKKSFKQNKKMKKNGSFNSTSFR